MNIEDIRKANISESNLKNAEAHLSAMKNNAKEGRRISASISYVSKECNIMNVSITLNKVESSVLIHMLIDRVSSEVQGLKDEIASY